MIDKMNILLIEDDQKTMEALKHDLVMLGIADEVFHAGNGEIALAQYNELVSAKKEVGLIICDIVMPVCNGIEFLEKFRDEFDPENKQPIVMLTSKSDKSLVLKAINFGVSQYLLKPWNQQGLMQKIMAALEEVSA
jgi:two-component system chemotaxis response regulator CheY